MGELNIYEDQVVSDSHHYLTLKEKAEIIECYVNNPDQTMDTLAKLMNSSRTTVTLVISMYIPKKSNGFKHVLVLQSKV